MKRKRDDNTFDDVQTIIKRIKLFISKKRKREEDDDELVSSCKRLKINNNNNSIYCQWRRDILIYT